MRILFDECVPKRLRRSLSKYEIKTVPEAGWSGIKNGELLKKAAESFDILITVDRNLAFQQNPTSILIPINLIHAKSNRIKDLEPFVPELEKLLRDKLSKTLHHIGV